MGTALNIADAERKQIMDGDLATGRLGEVSQDDQGVLIIGVGSSTVSMVFLNTYIKASTHCRTPS